MQIQHKARQLTNVELNQLLALDREFRENMLRSIIFFPNWMEREQQSIFGTVIS